MPLQALSKVAARACLALVMCALGSPVVAALGPADASVRSPASGLRDKYTQVRDRLDKNPYGRPLWLDSRELSRQLQGDAYAVIAQPFAKVQTALTPAANWCEVLMLPFNTKHCVAREAREGTRLSLFVGRKNDTPVENTFKLDFDYTLTSRTADYLELVLQAGDGPLGTRDYRIVLQATPLDENRTFLHFGYTYGYGTLSKVAMQAYLATAGSSKVGFTMEPGGEQKLVGGMRGVMERNTMRYYLAIDAFLGSMEVPPGARVAKRLNDWFSATERYPKQLNEDIGRAQYLAMKQREYARLGSQLKTAAGT